jgi:hypothetical protein
MCGELETVMVFCSRNYLFILLELLLFRYLNLLPDKYNLAHYNYIKSKCRNVFLNILVMRRRYAVSTAKYLPTFR